MTVGERIDKDSIFDAMREVEIEDLVEFKFTIKDGQEHARLVTKRNGIMEYTQPATTKESVYEKTKLPQANA